MSSIFKHSNEKILSTVERLRKKMVHSGVEKGFTAEETIHLSQQLDSVLNELQRSEGFDLKDSSPDFHKINTIINNEAAILITDLNREIIYTNNTCSSSMGYQSEELIGNNV